LGAGIIDGSGVAPRNASRPATGVRTVSKLVKLAGDIMRNIVCMY